MVRHHGSMRIADFALERYFARWEFAAEHLLCASDVEALPDGRAARAGRRRDPGAVGRARARLHRIDRPSAAPTRDRRAVRDDRRRRGPDLRRGRGGDLLPDERAVRAGRPRHRDLARLPEPVRGGASRRRRRHAPRAPRDRTAGRSTSTCCAARSRPRPASSSSTCRTTRPGCWPTARRSTALVAIAAEAGAHLLVDEVYRGLEFDQADRLPTGADAAPHGISLGVMSKAYALAGPADRLAGDATTGTCSPGSRRSRTTRRSARRRRRRSSRSSRCVPATGCSRDRAAIVAANLELLDAFFDDWVDRFTWVRPRAGSIGYPRLTVPGRPDRRLGGRAGRGRGRPAPAGLAVRPRRQPFPARASAGRTCPRRSRVSRRSRRGPSDDHPGPTRHRHPRRRRPRRARSRSTRRSAGRSPTTAFPIDAEGRVRIA